MPAVLIGLISRYTIGTAADVFPVPTAASPIPTGSTVTVLDTGVVFTWDGSQWVKAPAAAGGSSSDAAMKTLLAAATVIHQELVALRLGMIAAETCREVQSGDLGSIEPIYT